MPCRPNPLQSSCGGGHNFPTSFSRTAAWSKLLKNSGTKGKTLPEQGSGNAGRLSPAGTDPSWRCHRVMTRGVAPYRKAYGKAQALICRALPSRPHSIPTFSPDPDVSNVWTAHWISEPYSDPLTNKDTSVHVMQGAAWPLAQGSAWPSPWPAEVAAPWPLPVAAPSPMAAPSPLAQCLRGGVPSHEAAHRRPQEHHQEDQEERQDPQDLQDHQDRMSGHCPPCSHSRSTIGEGSRMSGHGAPPRTTSRHTGASRLSAHAVRNGASPWATAPAFPAEVLCACGCGRCA